MVDPNRPAASERVYRPGQQDVVETSGNDEKIGVFQGMGVAKGTGHFDNSLKQEAYSAVHENESGTIAEKTVGERAARDIACQTSVDHVIYLSRVHHLEASLKFEQFRSYLKKGWVLLAKISLSELVNFTVVNEECVFHFAGKDFRDNIDNGIIHLLALYGNSDIWNALPDLDKICHDSINSGNITTYTPLHLAARYNNAEIVEVLVESGARFDTLTTDKQTPLHVAAGAGSIDVLRIILEKCDPGLLQQQDKDQRTPLHLGCAISLTDHEKTLEDAEKKRHETEAKSTAIVKLLLEKGGLNSLQDKDGNTPLHLACRNGNIAVIHQIRQSDPQDSLSSIRNDEGKTPYDCATEECLQNILQSLSGLPVQNSTGDDKSVDSMVS